MADKVRVHRLSGYVEGPCAKCGKEERALLMFEDLSIGAECLACSHIEKPIDAEFIEDPVGRSILDEFGG